MAYHQNGMKKRGRRIVLLTGAVAVVALALATWLGWPHLVFLYRFAPLGLNAQGFPEYRHRQTGIVFVRLPGGRFWMGAQKTDPKGQNYDPEAQDKEGPVHEVTLSPFLIGKYEVTQAQWKSAMGSNPSGFKGDDRPVEQVSWDDLQGFEAKTGLRLPTEAQWEYGCRATNTTPIAGTGKLDDMGWYNENSGNTTHPVGQKAPNAFGLHDMHGNVWEWCEDVYDEKFYSEPEASEMNPICPAGSEDRVFRGGCWGDGAGGCRSAFRGEGGPAGLAALLGFRPAYRLP
jgi:formylglycine-generating enzyme required for sulfatase activity